MKKTSPFAPSITFWANEVKGAGNYLTDEGEVMEHKFDGSKMYALDFEGPVVNFYEQRGELKTKDLNFRDLPVHLLLSVSQLMDLKDLVDDILSAEGFNRDEL